MRESQGCVYVVDDDAAVRDSLRMLLGSVGYEVCCFPTANDFLEAYSDSPGCLVLDIRMPGMSGLELQEQLAQRDASIPIIFLTGHGDIPMAVEAMRGGALGFLEKPFRDQDLLDQIATALQQDRSTRAVRAERRDILERMERLTPREHQVMTLVTQGKANKVIAADLQLSQRTVEIHRARVMEKMQARSLAELVRMIVQAQGDAIGGDE